MKTYICVQLQLKVANVLETAHFNCEDSICSRTYFESSTGLLEASSVCCLDFALLEFHPSQAIANV